MNKTAYASIQASSNVQIKGMFTIEGPLNNIAYISKSIQYYGPLIQNSFEGKGIYYDLEQYFSYIGSFHYSMKEGFGILLQYSKTTFDYLPARDVANEKEYSAYSAQMNEIYAATVETWKSKVEHWKTTITSAEELMEPLLSSKSRGDVDYENILALCLKLKYETIKETQPSKTVLCYIGELKGDAREGIGISFYKNGDIYIGKFSKNKRTGFGIYLWGKEGGKSTSLIYLGYHNNNMFSKFAAVLLANNDFYIGQIATLSFSGKGTYLGPNKLWKYEGEFKQGKRFGYGKFIDFPGNWYCEGELKEDCFEGNGLQVWEEKERKVEYHGGFTANSKVGPFSLTCSDGSKLDGTMKDGMCSGKGVLHDSQGMCYEGDFERNQLHGKCKIKYPTGAECICSFSNGIRKGPAVVVLPPDKGMIKPEKRKLLFDRGIAAVL